MHGNNDIFNLITSRRTVGRLGHGQSTALADPAKVNLQVNLIIARLIIIIVQLRSITDPIYIGSSQIIVVRLDSTVRWTLASSSRKARVGTVVDGLVFVHGQCVCLN
jgi:hypothetical protein